MSFLWILDSSSFRLGWRLTGRVEINLFIIFGCRFSSLLPFYLHRKTCPQITWAMFQFDGCLTFLFFSWWMTWFGSYLHFSSTPFPKVTGSYNWCSPCKLKNNLYNKKEMIINFLWRWTLPHLSIVVKPRSLIFEAMFSRGS